MTRGHSAYPDKLRHHTIFIPDHKQFYRYLNNLLPQEGFPLNQVYQPEQIAIELLEDREEEKKNRLATPYYQLENEFPDEKELSLDELASEWLTNKKKKEQRQDSLIDKFIETEPSISKLSDENAVPPKPRRKTRIRPRNFSRKHWLKYTSDSNYMTRLSQLI